MTDTVSTEKLVWLRDRYQRSFVDWQEANERRAAAEKQMLTAKQTFEAAGGTKELMRRSVEMGESNA